MPTARWWKRTSSKSPPSMTRPPATLPDQVISAILGTREGAADAGIELSSIGVTLTDQFEAAVLRDALSAYRLENVMLVSAFLAATALANPSAAQWVTSAPRYLFVEPDTATLAVIETADGSIIDVYREPIDASPQRRGHRTAHRDDLRRWRSWNGSGWRCF